MPCCCGCRCTVDCRSVMYLPQGVKGVPCIWRVVSRLAEQYDLPIDLPFELVRSTQTLNPRPWTLCQMGCLEEVACM